MICLTAFLRMIASLQEYLSFDAGFEDDNATVIHTHTAGFTSMTALRPSTITGLDWWTGLVDWTD